MDRQIDKMKDLIKRNISGKKILVLFILTNIIYAIMLTITIPKVMSFSGGMKLLDMMPTGYNAEYVNSLLNTLGDKGRDAYLFYQLPIE
jgi:TM2 domain-containing membrane protein YozV